VIVTVTLNPALGVRYDADRVALGAANRVSGVRYHAGGRGLTVARLLQTFGHEVVAAGLAGGSSGELIRADLARAGVATQFTRISAESRRVVRIADAAAGQVTTLEEPAPYITTEELGRLAGDYRAMLDGATAVVLCGSLPAGLPAETYGSLTSYAVEADVPVILNADGSALRHGARRQPALVIPEAGASGSELMAAGAGAVVLLTSTGVKAVTADREWRASLGLAAGEPGASEAGAGERATGRRDALVAGFVPGIALGWTWPDMLRHALALADSVTPDGEADLAIYEKLLPEVKIAGPRR
jgi:tagatose 6-phosphate kinase